MKLQATKAQIEAIKGVVSDMEAMIGGGDHEVEVVWSKRVKLINRMLIKNELIPDPSWARPISNHPNSTS